MNTTVFLTEFIRRQRRWSLKTFGRGMRTIGITEHIKIEIEEVRRKPKDLYEWMDIIILAIDGYWRAGGNSRDFAIKLSAQQNRNMARTYPSPTSQDIPVEHIR